jgi:hypothetical protein
VISFRSGQGRNPVPQAGGWTAPAIEAADFNG